MHLDLEVVVVYISWWVQVEDSYRTHSRHRLRKVVCQQWEVFDKQWYALEPFLLERGTKPVVKECD